jgi:hypothetical protein
MTDADGTAKDDLIEAVQARTIPQNVWLPVWQTFRQIFATRGMNLAELPNSKARSYQQALPSGVSYEFESLCRAGCEPVTLMAVIWLSQYFPILGAEWKSIVGDKKERERKIQTLLAASIILIRLDQGLGFLKAKDSYTDAADAIGADFPLSPVLLSNGLSFYSTILKQIPEAAESVELRSSHDLQRFLPTNYVYIMTGAYRDKEVSAIIGAISSESIYDETAHRMWRFRNCERLSLHWQGLGHVFREIAEAIRTT